MRRSLKATLVLVLLLWAAVPARAGGADDLLGEAELELKQALRLLGELEEDVAKLQATGFEFIPEERFIDAQVYFDLKHFEKSALLLTSLLEDQRFKRNKRYFEAVKMLGIALYNEGNYQGAQRQFERLRVAGVEVDLAVTYLVEIAARLERAGDLRKLADSIQEVGASPGLLYAKGKALFFVGQPQAAMAVLKRLPAQGPLGFKARYISGAALVSQGRVKDAHAVFLALVKSKPGNEEEDQLLELAYLSLGRLDYELGDFSAAADHYQWIPRNSPYFEQALYEVTHVYLRWARQREDPDDRMRAYTKAEEILTILVSITKNPQLSRDARVLRGRISMFLEKYEQAREAYEEVIEMFASTSSEMTDIAQSPESIDRFFKAMIQGGNDQQQLHLFASPEVIAWMRNQPTLGRVVEMLTDVAHQRAALEEAHTIYEQLTYSLSQEAARELFPGFSDCWLKSLEVENRLLQADTLLLDAEKKKSHKRLSGTQLLRLDQLLAEREKLEKKLATAPRTVGAYKARSNNTMARLRAALRDADEQVLRIRAIQEQYAAMQKLLKEVKYKGSEMLQVRDEDALEREIREEGQKLVGLLQEAQAVRAEVEKEMLVAEVGDVRSRSEQDVKLRLWQQHGQEASHYIDATPELPPDAQRTVERANNVRRNIMRTRELVQQQQEGIDRKAQKQIVYYRKVLREEKAVLDRREQELRDTERAAIAFARKVGAELFLDAKEELVKAVVEADLGLVDLTWKRKENESKQIQAIQQERARVVKRLREDLRVIAGEDEGSE